MKTIWALAGALCLATRFAQAAPTADVSQDVGNGVNQISEKSGETPIASTEFELDVATPILVSRVSTILTAATPAIYQDAAKNPNELSEKIVKPVTLLLNSVSGGVTTLAKDNSRRFFVPSFVRFNFRHDALLELDRIRRTERFWNETEQYVDSVCARLKKYIDTQRRRGVQAVTAPTPMTPTTTSTVASPSAPSSLATSTPVKLSSSTAVHVAVKAERPAVVERSDLKLSVRDTVEPIKVPDAGPPHQKPKPTHESQGTLQAVPVKEAAAEVLAPVPIDATEVIESSSVVPSEAAVETTSIPSKIESGPSSTEKVPETTAASEETVTSGIVTSTAGVIVPKVELSTPLPGTVPSSHDDKVPALPSGGSTAAESVRVEQVISPSPVGVAAEKSASSPVSPSESVPAVVSARESLAAPVPTSDSKTTRTAQDDLGVVATSRNGGSLKEVHEEKTPSVATARSEPQIVVGSETPLTSTVVPEVVKAAEVPQADLTPSVSSPSHVAADAPVDVEQRTPEASSPIPLPVTATATPSTVTTPETKVSEAIVPAEVSQAVPVAASSASSEAPLLSESVAVSTTPADTTRDPVVEFTSSVAPESASTAGPVSEVVPEATAPTVSTPTSDSVTTPAVHGSSVAESTEAAVTFHAPTVTSTETSDKIEAVVTASTETPVTGTPAVETTTPVVELHHPATQESETIHQGVVPTVRPIAGDVHRVHPVAPSIVFPSKAPTKISQSVKVSQFSTSSGSSEDPVTFVSSTTVTTSRSDSSKSTINALRFEKVALSHPIVIRPVKSPLPIAIPHRVIKHNADGVSIVRTQSSGLTIGDQHEKHSP